MSYTRRLHKSANDKFISGVAGGMAEYFQIDPVFVRLGWFLSVFVTGGLSILAYLVMVFVVPKRISESPGTPGAQSDQTYERDVESESKMSNLKEQRRYLLGICLIIVGIVFLLYNLNVFDFLDWGITAAVLIIAVGTAVIYASLRQQR